MERVNSIPYCFHNNHIRLAIFSFRELMLELHKCYGVAPIKIVQTPEHRNEVLLAGNPVGYINACPKDYKG